MDNERPSHRVHWSHWSHPIRRGSPFFSLSIVHSPLSISPQFPLRIIYDDGDSLVIETPEELLTEVDNVDSGDAGARVWIRDALDRTVRLRMHGGEIQLLELA
jgi:hypothetical protein